MKFFRFVVPGAGKEPPDCRSTIWPYQFALMLLFENVECAADCTGEFVPPLASRNRIPTVQLSRMKFSTTVMLSVWLRKIRPVRLKSIVLLRTVWPLLLLISIPVRLPVIVLSRMVAPVIASPWIANPAEFRPGLFQSVVLFPSRVTVKPAIVALFAEMVTVVPAPPIGPLIVVVAGPAPSRFTPTLLTLTSSL